MDVFSPAVAEFRALAIGRQRSSQELVEPGATFVRTADPNSRGSCIRHQPEAFLSLTHGFSCVFEGSTQNNNFCNPGYRRDLRLLARPIAFAADASAKTGAVMRRPKSMARLKANKPAPSVPPPIIKIVCSDPALYPAAGVPDRQGPTAEVGSAIRGVDISAL